MAYKQKNSLEQKIITLLRTNMHRYFSLREIMALFKCDSERYAQRVVSRLVDNKVIYRKRGTGNSFYYTCNNLLKVTNPLEELVVDAREIPRVDVHPRNVRTLLKNWSEEKWDPKIFHSAQYLPLGIASLYAQVAEVMYGSKVSKKDLAEIRLNLEAFKKDLIATCTTLFSLLETEELWDPDKFFEFLMSEDAPPVDLIQDWVHKLKEKYSG